MFSHCLVSIILSQSDQCLVTDWSVLSQSLISVKLITVWSVYSHSLISVNLVTVLSVLDTVCLSVFVSVWSVFCHSLVSALSQSGQCFVTVWSALILISLVSFSKSVVVSFSHSLSVCLVIVTVCSVLLLVTVLVNNWPCQSV